MSYRVAGAIALVAYAVAVLVGATSGHMSPVALSILDIPRAIAAVLLAFGLLMRSRVIDLLAVAYIVWFGMWGVIAMLGPVYQFVVPDSAGMTIVPDTVRFGVALASEVALVAAAIALCRDAVRSVSRSGISGTARAPRAAGGPTSSPGGSARSAPRRPS